MSAIAAPSAEKTIQDWQRKTFEQLHEMVPEALVEDGSSAVGDQTRSAWVETRTRLIDEIMDCILDIANGMPEGVEDPGVTRMLARAIELQRAARDDASGEDSRWRVRRAARDLKDAAHLMERRLSRLQLDEPSEAASFAINTLRSVETQEIARLFGVSAKTVSQWRGGKVSAIKKSPDRVVLVGQLIRYLQSSWTPHGVLAWFAAPRERLGGRTPLELIESENPDAWVRLRELARGGRSQLAD